MSLIVPGAARKWKPRPERPGPGYSRKVAILGTAPTLKYAPFEDPGWRLMAHTSAANMLPVAPDYYIDTHPAHCFQEGRKNGFRDYYGWLKYDCRVPVFMQDAFKEIPTSIRYPLERVKQEFPWPLGSLTSEMIALCLLDGVTHLGLFGTHYAHGTEYAEQRANTEMWVGIAIGRGVQVIIPAESPLCHEPALDYGFESHATPEIYAARKKVFAQAKRDAMTGAMNPSKLQPLTTPEQEAAAETLRRAMDPEWAKAADEMKDDAQPPEFHEWELRTRVLSVVAAESDTPLDELGQEDGVLP